MNSLMSVFVLLTVSSIAKMAEISQNTTTFNCDYLPNGCKFEQAYDEFKPLADEIFVCNDLEKRFDFNPEVFKSCKKNAKSSTKVYFRSDKILDQSFEFTSIDNFLNKINPFREFIRNVNEIKFKGINGIDLNLQTLNRSNRATPLLKFFETRFEFFSNNRLINSCEDFKNMNLTEPKSVFQLGTILRPVDYEFINARFSNPICPIFFDNIQTQKLYFEHMIKTFYKSSFLKFSSNSNKLNSNIRGLYMVKSEKIDIDSILLDENVFKNIRLTYISGEINSIEEGVFKPFKSLRQIRLDLGYFEKLIHKGTKWISYINHDLHVNISNRDQLELNINRTVRIYVQDMASNMALNHALNILARDEDFCLFKDFPFDQMVNLLIDNLTENFSCTFIWLLKVYHLYYKKLEPDNFKNINLLEKGNWTEMIEKCGFEKRLENCERGENFGYVSNWNINDTKEIVNLIEFILIFLIPFISLFGLLSNTLIIFVVSLGENEEYLKAKQYSYMRIASLSNALVCLISVLTPIYQCQTFEGIFCSSINHLVFTQYFRIICVEFISSVLKMLSNFSYIGFLISRSSLIGKNHGKFIQIFSDLSVVKFILVSLFISVILSIVKLLHYQVNTFNTYLNYPTEFELNANNLFEIGFEIKTRLLNIFNAISDLFNYVIFIVFNLILDVFLLVKLKATLEERINSNGNNHDVLNRAIVSVVSYTLFSIVFKVPASIKSVLDSIIFNKQIGSILSLGQINYYYEVFCLNCRICPMFELFSNLLFIFSISCNVFFYFMFDNRFKIGLRIAYSKLFSSKKEHLEYLRNIEETIKTGRKKTRNKKVQN